MSRPVTMIAIPTAGLRQTAWPRPISAAARPYIAGRSDLEWVTHGPTNWLFFVFRAAVRPVRKRSEHQVHGGLQQPRVPSGWPELSAIVGHDTTGSAEGGGLVRHMHSATDRKRRATHRHASTRQIRTLELSDERFCLAGRQ